MPCTCGKDRLPVKRKVRPGNAQDRNQELTHATMRHVEHELRQAVMALLEAKGVSDLCSTDHP
jgi:hypothetical protein